MAVREYKHSLTNVQKRMMMKMTILTGKSVFGGIAIGRLSFYKRGQGTIQRRHVEDTAQESQRFEEARQQAIRELKGLYDKALQEVGEANAAIFEIHQMMLDDLDYRESVSNIIETQKVNAEYAVGTTADNFAQMFSSMDDAYMQGRAADVKDVSDRVLRILSGGSDEGQTLTEPCIIAADDLVPSETVQLDKSRVLAFATMYGSANSHTAILARTMGIPAVIGLGERLDPSMDGVTAVVDGFEGRVILDPDAETLAVMQDRQKQEQKRRELLLSLRGKETVTKDGRMVNLYANIGNVSDLGAALQNDAGGIGLFRSEFLYLENEDYPTEEEQFQVYKTAAMNMAGKKVIIRTLDIGADKQAPYFELPKEENPAMGMRAIRICLTRPQVFKTQLRALYRASAFGQIAIMFPMITSLKEVRAIRGIAEGVKSELKAEGIPFQEDVELGIMIETPAAVMVSPELAREVDFFSVGTNDLTQYTLAVDRQNSSLEEFFDPRHPAVLRMLRMTAEAAHQAGIWVGICGELAADLELTEEFLRMGIDELSVSPGMILPLRQKIRELDLSDPR